MSECEGKDCSAQEHQPTPEVVEQAVADTAGGSVVSMQHVIITLADGRRGVFMGPEFIKEVEMKLGLVPKLVSVDFDPPRVVSVPVPREVPTDLIKEEMPNADTQAESKPAEGLE